MGNVQMKDIRSLAHGNLSEFETRKERRLFDMLDKNKSGSVTLEDLMLANEDPLLSAEIDKLGLPKFELKPQDVKRSLLTLYHFDRNRVCEMDFWQFVGLIRYLKTLDEYEEQLKQQQQQLLLQQEKEHQRQLKAEQEQLMKHGNDNNSNNKEDNKGHKSAAKSKMMLNSLRRRFQKIEGEVAAAVAAVEKEKDKEKEGDEQIVDDVTARGLPSFTSATSLAQGEVKRYSCSQDGERLQAQTIRMRVPMFAASSQTSFNPNSIENNPLAAEDAATRATLLAKLKTPKGRVRFMQWLFRLADTDHTDCVTPKELYMFLKAVAADGINPECVCMDPTVADMTAPMETDLKQVSEDEPIEGIPIKNEEDKKFHKVVRRVLNSFDILHDGVLSRSEFMVLADLIEREYELSDTYTGGEYIGDYHLLRTLGLGSEGQVKLAIDEKSSKAYAIKIVKRGNTAMMSRLDREVQAMIMLQHPNVANVYEVMETKHHVYIVLELCTGGELSSHINPKNPLSEPVARYYFAQLVSGVSYCHSRGVCHRDLRVENLLLDSHGQLKITDFGHAGTFQPGWDIFQTMFVGSLSHLAPEQIQGTAYSGEKLDVWSIGVILYYFLIGRNPFGGRTVETLFENISKAHFREKGLFATINPTAQSAIREMLQLEPKLRPPSSDLVHHPWLVGGKCEQLVMVKMEALALPNSNGTFDPVALRDALLVNLKYHLIECRIVPSEDDPRYSTTVIQCVSRFVDRERNIAFTLVLSPPDLEHYSAAALEGQEKFDDDDDDDDDDDEGHDDDNDGEEGKPHHHHPQQKQQQLQEDEDAATGGARGEESPAMPNPTAKSESGSVSGSIGDSTTDGGDVHLPSWRVAANLLSGDGWFFNRIFMRLVHTKYTCGKLVLLEYMAESAKTRRQPSAPKTLDRSTSVRGSVTAKTNITTPLSSCDRRDSDSCVTPASPGTESGLQTTRELSTTEDGRFSRRESEKLDFILRDGEGESSHAVSISPSSSIVLHGNGNNNSNNSNGDSADTPAAVFVAVSSSSDTIHDNSKDADSASGEDLDEYAAFHSAVVDRLPSTVMEDCETPATTASDNATTVNGDISLHHHCYKLDEALEEENANKNEKKTKESDSELLDLDSPHEFKTAYLSVKVIEGEATLSSPAADNDGGGGGSGGEEEAAR